MADPKADAAPAPGSAAGVTPSQAQKGASGALAESDGINAHITDAIPGREPKPELAPDDPGINASVVS
jgi:hypothetical protein